MTEQDMTILRSLQFVVLMVRRYLGGHADREMLEVAIGALDYTLHELGLYDGDGPLSPRMLDKLDTWPPEDEAKEGA